MMNFIKNISPTELAIIAGIFIVLFGSKAFISLGKTSGESFREIKKIKRNLTDAFEDDDTKGKEKGVSN